MAVAVWDSAHWDTDEWAAPPPPEPGWGDDWRWWYQIGAAAPWMDLTPLVVEARWTTDSHTMGDGTFRGDLQPGAVTVRMWDPDHVLDNIDKAGAVWALYRPTGACWCWFYDTFSRGLVAPGDPQGADCVFTGNTWPNRLTTDTTFTNFASHSVANRFAAIISALTAATYLHLPLIRGAIAAQTQLVTAAALNTQDNLYPSVLALVRDAASPGVAWLAPTGPPASDTAPADLTLNYARWETTNSRTLDRSQIIAGPAVTASVDWVVTVAGFTAINGSNGSQTSFSLAQAGQAYGYQGPSPFRMWGNVASGTGAEYPATSQTVTQLFADRADGAERVLSSVDVQSGTRNTPTGGISEAAWDPRAHVFSPLDVVSILDDAGNPKWYRVTKSDHRLTAQVWQTTHTLEKFTAPQPLP